MPASHNLVVRRSRIYSKITAVARLAGSNALNELNFLLPAFFNICVNANLSSTVRD